jgi:hypothetical protein
MAILVSRLVETVSNTSVRRLARLSRGLRYGLLALVSTVGLSLGYIPIQQQILRRRAEPLSEYTAYRFADQHME